MIQITNDTYKGKSGIQVETTTLRALILPREGAAVVSLYDKLHNEELLYQAGGEEYRSLGADGNYIDCECAGFDDMFPTIDPCDNGRRSGGRMYADHGETARAAFEVTSNSESVTLTMKSPHNDYIFTKRYSENGDGRLRIDYEATNLTNEKLPCLWAAHIMLRAHEGQSVIFEAMASNSATDDAEASAPTTAEMIFYNYDESACDKCTPTYKKGDLLTMDALKPLLTSRQASRNAYKVYMDTPYQRVRYGSLLIESEGAPYVGLWLNNGAFKGIHTVAPEVCTAGYDTPQNAERHGQRAYIEPHSAMRWSVLLSAEK